MTHDLADPIPPAAVPATRPGEQPTPAVLHEVLEKALMIHAEAAGTSRKIEPGQPGPVPATPRPAGHD